MTDVVVCLLELNLTAKTHTNCAALEKNRFPGV